MFDLEFSKLLLLGVIALLVIKPKDLPKTLRTLGYWVRHARQVASEFQGSIEQMVREAELADVKKDIEDATRQLNADIQNTLDPVDVEKALNDPANMSHVISSAPPAIEPPAVEAAAAAASSDEPTLPFPDLPAVTAPGTPPASPAPAEATPPSAEPVAATSAPHDRA